MTAAVLALFGFLDRTASSEHLSAVQAIREPGVSVHAVEMEPEEKQAGVNGIEDRSEFGQRYDLLVVDHLVELGLSLLSGDGPAHDPPGIVADVIESLLGSIKRVAELSLGIGVALEFDSHVQG